MPMGVIDGLPVGLSIVARPGDEAIMLAVAAGFERVVDLARGDALRPRSSVLRRADRSPSHASAVPVTDQFQSQGFATLSACQLNYVVYAPSSIRRPTSRPPRRGGAATSASPPTLTNRSTSASRSPAMNSVWCPTEEVDASPTTYWGVDDVAQAVADAEANGAVLLEAPQDVGDGIIVASVENPSWTRRRTYLQSSLRRQ